MKVIIQRVNHASVTVDQICIGEIQRGYLILVGFAPEDTEQICQRFIDKILKLRIFEDEQGKTNRSIQDVNGELLIVSQFTLYADCKKGNRPSFTQAAKPEIARQLYDYFVTECKRRVEVVQTGEFGADMKVKLENDGPFTIVLDDSIL